MLTFKSFDIENEEKEIVQFLKDNSDKLLAKGGTYHEGRICFFLSTEVAPVISPAEQDKAAALDFVDKKINEYKGMILESDSNVHYFKGMMVKNGDKKSFKTEKGYMSAGEMVDTNLETRDNQAINLAGLVKMRAEIEVGNYSFDKVSAV